MKNFILANCDTDSISIGKPDGSPFLPQEQAELIKEINSIFNKEITFANDGYFSKFVILRAKNYIMYDGKKTNIKGSALKSSTLEPRLKDFLNEIIQLILSDKIDQLLPVYNQYVNEINNIQNIKPWAKKMTLSETTFLSDRENEAKVIRAIQGKEYKEGDKIYVYPKDNGELGLVEDYTTPDYNKNKFYEKLFKTVKRFDTILDISQCLNYKLKKNKKLLEEIN